MTGCSHFNSVNQVVYNKYVDLQLGNIPVILTIPHSGYVNLHSIPIRNNGCNLVLRNDLNVDLISQKISNHLYKTTGNKPYIIKNMIHRRYLDVNRKSECAYENILTEDVYNEYHSYIHNMINNLTELYGRVLLIDLHGQCKYNGDIFIGTIKGKTIEKSVELEIVENFVDMGYNVSDDYWHGGYTVNTYGKHINPNVDAFQIEIDKKYRLNEIYINKFSIDFVKIINKIYD